MPPLLLEYKRVFFYLTLLAIDISSFSVIRAEKVAIDTLRAVQWKSNDLFWNNYSLY